MSRQGRSCASWAARHLGGGAGVTQTVDVTQLCPLLLLDLARLPDRLDALLGQLCGNDTQLLDAVTQHIQVFLDCQHRILDLT